MPKCRRLKRHFRICFMQRVHWRNVSALSWFQAVPRLLLSTKRSSWVTWGTFGSSRGRASSVFLWPLPRGTSRRAPASFRGASPSAEPSSYPDYSNLQGGGGGEAEHAGRAFLHWSPAKATALHSRALGLLAHVPGWLRLSPGCWSRFAHAGWTGMQWLWISPRKKQWYREFKAQSAAASHLGTKPFVRPLLKCISLQLPKLLARKAQVEWNRAVAPDSSPSNHRNQTEIFW